MAVSILQSAEFSKAPLGPAVWFDCLGWNIIAETWRMEVERVARRLGMGCSRAANLHSAISRDRASRCEEADDPRRTDPDRFFIGLDDKVRIGGRFVGI
jgi:hypothetical protein